MKQILLIRLRGDHIRRGWTLEMSIAHMIITVHLASGWSLRPDHYEA